MNRLVAGSHFCCLSICVVPFLVSVSQKSNLFTFCFSILATMLSQGPPISSPTLLLDHVLRLLAVVWSCSSLVGCKHIPFGWVLSHFSRLQRLQVSFRPEKRRIRRKLLGPNRALRVDPFAGRWSRGARAQVGLGVDLRRIRFP